MDEAPIQGVAMSGKGSTPRPFTDREQFESNFDKIDFSHSREQPEPKEQQDAELPSD